MKYRYLYGPVPSWRLGSSLGVDLTTQSSTLDCASIARGNLSTTGATPEKICSFNCSYCQLGNAVVYSDKRRVFVPTEEVITEIKNLPSVHIDYFTFSGMGEPTLAENLGEVVGEIKKIRKEKLAILTNASLINEDDVIADLSNIDFVMAKLDAFSQGSLEQINKPLAGMRFDDIIKGLKKFRQCYRGKLALQMMFVKENRDNVQQLADWAREIKPDEVQLNTPLRFCNVSPLSREDMKLVEQTFQGLNVISVYDVKAKEAQSISDQDTEKRRGKI